MANSTDTHYLGKIANEATTLASISGYAAKIVTLQQQEHRDRAIASLFRLFRLYQDWFNENQQQLEQLQQSQETDKSNG